jgi:hypothetical protein
MTLWLETPARLVVTIPNVAVPIVSWLGVGNLVSVLFPVGGEPLVHRWEQRRDVRANTRWIAHLVLAYALYYVADPTGGIEHAFFWSQVPRAIAPIFLPRESQFRPHRHRGGRLGYYDRRSGAVRVGARPSDRGHPEIG